MDNKRLLTKVMQLEQQLRFSSLGDAVNSRKTASTSSLSSQDEAAGSEQHSMDIITNLEERLQRLTDQNEVVMSFVGVQFLYSDNSAADVCTCIILLNFCMHWK